ncbi:hypothetical protein [Fodinicola feengrottensis]|uniref:hypothetical protein n=1 Tax=Fodinicola feengrottensis TaxID=435914 RepID=UPI002442AE92|nr:hypothetical protein [Fodinicola feengrottensis]
MISKHALDAFGHAHCRALDVQVWQAPLPAAEHGPQDAPQQNQDASPDHSCVVPQDMGTLLSSVGTLGERTITNRR